jgi:hypothetical protein
LEIRELTKKSDKVAQSLARRLILVRCGFP